MGRGMPWVLPGLGMVPVPSSPLSLLITVLKKGGKLQPRHPPAPKAQALTCP